MGDKGMMKFEQIKSVMLVCNATKPTANNNPHCDPFSRSFI